MKTFANLQIKSAACKSWRGFQKVATSLIRIFFDFIKDGFLALHSAFIAMKIITTAAEMMKFATEHQNDGNSVGFVPTMGALHDGHASLNRIAKQQNAKVVVSVFVNPTQFNATSDLQNYPRTFDSDRTLLEQEEVDVMFFPSIEEVYPNSNSIDYEMDGLDQVMEGPNRPGHFNGVVQVVTRLFELVKPTNAYFGEKDFQQLAIIKHMSQKLGYGVNVVGCPTIRESDGLAMSSRNARLTVNGKQVSNLISRSLFNMKNGLDNGLSVDQVVEQAKEHLHNNSSIELEYLELVNPKTLAHASDKDASIQACIAAWVDGVRLIDNLRVK